MTTEQPPIVMPVMSSEQTASWHGLMDLHVRVPTGWTLVGGQLVHLHCAERGGHPERPTDDIDAVVDVRTASDMLETFTRALLDLGFAPDTSGDGLQHRWRRNQAQIDVLLPTLLGALVMKAAAHTVGDRAPGRHRLDFVTLAGLVSREDFRGALLNSKDRRRLRQMVAACRADAIAMEPEHAADSLARLERAAAL